MFIEFLKKKMMHIDSIFLCLFIDIFNCNRSLLDICLIGTNLRKFLCIGEKYQGFVRLVLKKKNVKGISLRLENHGNLHKTVPILIFYKIVF